MLDFPNSPVVGDVYQGWRWDGGKWAASLGVAGPPGPPGPVGPAGPSGQSAGRIFYYATSDNSDIATYKTMLSSPSAGAEQTITTAVSGTSDFLVATFATDPGVPGAVDYPAGTAYRRIYARVDQGGPSVAQFHLQVYVRTAAGVETLVRDEHSAQFQNTTVALQEWIAAAPGGGSMLATDRIVNKLYAARVSGGSGSFNVITYFEGSTHASQIQTTISAGAQGPAGPGVAAGGTSGQVLSKIDATDYNTQWLAPTARITVSDTAPVSPTDGDLWFDSGSTAKLYIRFNDTNTTQWVPVA